MLARAGETDRWQGRGTEKASSGINVGRGRGAEGGGGHGKSDREGEGLFLASPCQAA